MSRGGAIARGLAFALLGLSSSACRTSTRDAPSSPKASLSLAVPTASSPALSLPVSAAVSAAALGDFAAPPSDARREACGSLSRLLVGGSGARRAGDDDRVLLEYATFARSGQPLDSSAMHEPTAESMRNLAPGLACVVKRMAVGESRRVWLPATLLATAPKESSPAAPDELTIDVTLRQLSQAPQRPRDYAKPSRTAQRTATGLYFETLHRGSGQQRPVANSRVTISHSGWTNRGVLFESSALAGHPASYLTYELPKGLCEGIQLMHVGDKLRFWLPERLAYSGAHFSAAKGPVVFDVELLAID